MKTENADTAQHEDPLWYAPPLTKKHIADLREKLGATRGKLIELLEIMVNSPKANVGRLSITIDDLKYLIEHTSD